MSFFSTVICVDLHQQCSVIGQCSADQELAAKVASLCALSWQLSVLKHRCAESVAVTCVDQFQHAWPLQCVE